MAVSGSMTKDGLFESKVDPCGVYSFTVKANSILSIHCDIWIHGRCSGLKIAIAKFS